MGVFTCSILASWPNTWKMCSPASAIFASIVTIRVSFEAILMYFKACGRSLLWNWLSNLIYKYCDLRILHLQVTTFSSIGSKILVSFTTILMSIFTILASIEQVISELGSKLIGKFDWIFHSIEIYQFSCHSDFRYVKSIQKVKNCHFDHFGGFELLFLDIFHTQKCQKIPKIPKIPISAQMVQMAVFRASKWPKLISRKIWVAEKSWNFHIVYSQLGYPGM